MTTQLNYATMQSALSLLHSEFCGSAPLSAYGLSRDDMAILSKESLYQQSDRVRVQRALSSMVNGTAGFIGVAPFAVPAEFIAAIICKFVHACNVRIACNWMSIIPAVPADDMAQDLASEPVSPARLFSLVLLARGNDSSFEAGFDSKVKKAIIKQGGQNV